LHETQRDDVDVADCLAQLRDWGLIDERDC
jgi:hypothetical protein